MTHKFIEDQPGITYLRFDTEGEDDFDYDLEAEYYNLKFYGREW